jgi:hypothetical protein
MLPLLPCQVEFYFWAACSAFFCSAKKREKIPISIHLIKISHTQKFVRPRHSVEAEKGKKDPPASCFARIIAATFSFSRACSVPDPAVLCFCAGGNISIDTTYSRGSLIETYHVSGRFRILLASFVSLISSRHGGCEYEAEDNVSWNLR